MTIRGEGKRKVMQTIYLPLVTRMQLFSIILLNLFKYKTSAMQLLVLLYNVNVIYLNSVKNNDIT